MKFLGNYASWIKDIWLDEVIRKKGIGRPKAGQKPDSIEMMEEYKRAKEAGYSENAVYFWMFNKNNVTFDITCPPFVNEKYHWWITKMLPSNFMPMHTDPHTLYEKSSKRFWIPLQDWQVGHIFMYENQVITDYKKGDVYMYSNSTALHGAANIGYTPRVVLQISTYE